MESLAPIVSYILEGEFPQSFTKAQKQRLMEKASSYLFLEGALFQRGKDQVCRRIPTVEEIPSILEGLHEEACGGHFAQELTAKKILLSGYVWPSLHIDVQHWCKSFHNYQVNGNKHLLHGPRQLLLANGPFEKWGIDAMGPLPRTKNGKLYILVVIDYMTRFGTPLEIVSDNGPGFRKGLLTEVCEELHILHRHSTPYYPQSNGLVEKANGIIAGIIRNMVKNKTKLWDNFLDGALWAYRTTYKEATEFTPFHLVYGQEALQPIELNIPTMRLHGKAAQRKEEEWTDRLLTLAELEWKREAAYECYKRKATQVKDKLDKEVKDKGIKEGDLVLRYDNRLDNRFDAKFETRWQGPYIVKKSFNSSYYQLMDLDEKEHPRKVNGYRLKPYLSRILPKDLQDQRQKSTLSHKSCSLVQLDRILALNYYEEVTKKVQIKANECVKDKGIEKGDLVLRYNSKLDNTFQKKFQIKWEGPFIVVIKFDNGTYQLADLDGTEHKYRVNGYRLKKYLARLMTIVTEEMLLMEKDNDKVIENVNEVYGDELQQLFTLETSACHK
ncbi:hypothetical protein L7F22_033346 [Adiantum nelumboides]|nr:hypothetical protein [Adiantum nelumboides]